MHIKSTTYPLVLLLSIFLFSCQSEEPQVKKMHQELMDYHDEVMIRHGEMMKYEARLEKLKGGEDNTPEIFLAKIKTSDDAMWEWMHNWKKPKKDLDLSTKMEHYLKWDKRMIRVDNNIKMTTSQLKNYFDE